MSRFKWGRGLITLILFFLLTAPCRAQDNLLSKITLRQYPIGSFSARYGGARGFIRNQIVNQSHSLHRDWIERTYNDRPFAARKKFIALADSQRDLNNGGAWFRRRWWESLPESKGGAPAFPIISYRGPTGKLLDVGFAFITSDFRFKFNEYSADLTSTFNPSSSFYTPKNKWNFRFSPDANFSVSTILRRVSFRFIFEYSERDVHLFDITIYTLYSIRLMEFRGGISFSLLQW